MMKEEAMRSARVPRVMFGVPPNISSPGIHRAWRHSAHQSAQDQLWKTERRDKTVSLPNHPHAAHGQSQSKWIKPMLPVKLPGKSMQTIYHE
jgi:hypothetical protein